MRNLIVFILCLCAFFFLYLCISCTSVKDSQVSGSNIGASVPVEVVLNESE